MKTSGLLAALLAALSVGRASAESFEVQAGREIQRISNQSRCRGYYSGLIGRMAGVHVDAAVARCVEWLEGGAEAGVQRLSSVTQAAAVPAKEFGSLYKCENRPALSIELKPDGTVTVNGDNLVPDGADHPYKGISYNCSFADENTFKIRIFGKLGSIDVDAALTMTLVDGRRNLRVSKADQSSKDGRRIGEDEAYTCSRAFFQRW